MKSCGCADRRDASSQGAFTLIELLVVIAIITLLLAILVPGLNMVRRQATGMLGMRNQREIASGVTLFASENDDRFPDSIATIGYEGEWSWYDPTAITGKRKRTPQVHRAMSAYLRDYIADGKTMYCPGAPRPYTYAQASWEAGDEWDNPDTPVTYDPVDGTFCFYWNYVGYLGEPRMLFRGPSGPAAGGRQSQLLVTDYFGYGPWQTPGAFASCEKLPGGDVVEETWLAAALWTAEGDPNEAMPDVKLRAAYVDGHVSTYTPEETVPLRVSLTSEGVPPYPDGTGSRGIFYIPEDAVN
ncbi:MAG: type II secretion system protein [Phycisphaerae bacterium]|nr:type II secretion system protein [Phycisphaerae bacterium]